MPEEKAKIDGLVEQICESRTLSSTCRASADAPCLSLHPIRSSLIVILPASLSYDLPLPATYVQQMISNHPHCVNKPFEDKNALLFYKHSRVNGFPTQGYKEVVETSLAVKVYQVEKREVEELKNGKLLIRARARGQDTASNLP